MILVPGDGEADDPIEPAVAAVAVAPDVVDADGVSGEPARPDRNPGVRGHRSWSWSWTRTRRPSPAGDVDDHGVARLVVDDEEEDVTACGVGPEVYPVVAGPEAIGIFVHPAARVYLVEVRRSAAGRVGEKLEVGPQRT